MKNIVNYLLILTFLSVGSSCTNLDEEIKDDFTTKIVPENTFGKADNVNKPTPVDGLAGAFGKLTGGTANHGSYFSAQEISTDEAVITQKGGDWYDGGIWINMHKHQFTPTVGGINGAWGDTYGGIFQCNDLIADSKTTTAGKAQLKALRAYYYWRLLDMFGRVKIVTVTGEDAPQATRLEVYTFVEQELLAALPNLPTGKQEYGRLNQSGANALLSRLYLNAKVYKSLASHDPADLDKAIAAADQVINSGLYNLDPDYAKVFAPDNVENQEHIFVVPFDEATAGGMNLAQMTLHYPSQLTYQLQEQPWNGYLTLEEFYNSYDAADKRRSANFIVGLQKDTKGVPLLDVAFDKGDEDGQPLNYTPKINMLFPNGSRQAGARFGKFRFKQRQRQSMDNDYPLLRYAEVLLNKAEALALKNGYGDAMAKILVDQIRTRAGLPSIGTLTEGALLAERGRELFLESLRRTDLIRFGAWGNAWWEKGTHPADKYILFPIPAEQITASQSSTNKLTQNPDYQ